MSKQTKVTAKAKPQPKTGKTDKVQKPHAEKEQKATKDSKTSAKVATADVKQAEQATQSQTTQAEFEKQLRQKAEQGDAQACFDLVEYAEKIAPAQNMLEAQNRVNLLVQASNKGVGVASLLLGRWYLQGHYVEKDAVKAILFFEHAGIQGQSYGYYQLAEMFQTGAGVPANLKKGADYLQKAVSMNNADAILTYATQVLAQDPAQAFQIVADNAVKNNHVNSLVFLADRPEFDEQKVLDFLHKYETGNPFVQSLLAVRYVQKGELEKALPYAEFATANDHPLGTYTRSLIEFNLENGDQQLAEQLMVKAAQLGHTEAAYRVGADLLQLASQQEDFQEADRILPQALNFIAHAAQQGFSPAQYSLGQCWSQGLGVEQNVQEAVAWFERAARQGNVDAMFSLAMHLPMEHEAHLPWLDAAAQAGHPKALLCRGLYEQQQQRPQQAMEWFNHAKERGDVRADFMLGMAYLKGEGVETDSKRAVELLNQAGEKGDVDGYFALYEAYRDGVGVRKNKKSLARYLKLAKEGQHPKALDIEE
ncbi:MULTISPECIES: tetratricopeptide repeat protein [unclassified Acinetobacter]|uniref:tetratricopeptide repeat protein n=1 Tax=unclassified Acinetobacter TaxID=196816 RepID=UPI0035B802DB